MNPKLPPALKPRDTIGVVCTSYPYAVKLKKQYARGLHELERLGYRVKLGKHTERSAGLVNASARERAQDLHAMFLDPEVRAIILINGGTLASEVLDELDYDLIARHPTILIGYSDVTAILLGITARTGMPTFHGPMLIPQFGEFPHVQPYTLKSFTDATTSTDGYTITASDAWTDEFLDSTKGEDSHSRTMRTNPGWTVARHGTVHGKVVCGNLRIICSLLGTPYAPSFDGAILILEDLGIKTDELKRNLIHLAQAGVLRSVRAIAWGRLLRVEPKDGVSVEDVVREVVGDIPLVYGLDVGHTDPVATITNGVEATLDTQAKTIRFGPTVK